MTSFPLAMLGGVALGVVDRVVLANTTEDPGTNTLVMFVLLVRARAAPGAVAERPTSRRGRLTPRTRAGRAGAAQAPARAASLRYGGIAAPARARPRCCHSSRRCPSRLIDYSDRARLPDGRGVGDRAHGLGRPAVARAVRVRRASARTSPPYYGAEHRASSRRSRSARCGASVIAIVIGIPALRVRGLYLGIITLGFALDGERLRDPAGPVQHLVHRVRRRASNRPTVGPVATSPTDKQAYYYFCLVCAARRDRDREPLPPHRHRPLAARGARQRDQRRRVHGVAHTGEARSRSRSRAASPRSPAGCSRPGTPTQIPDYFAPAESLRVLAISVVGGLSSVTGAVLGTLVIVAIPTVFEGSRAAAAVRQRRRHADPAAVLPGRADLDRRQRPRPVLLAFIARRTDWKPPAAAHAGERRGAVDARDRATPTVAESERRPLRHRRRARPVRRASGRRRRVDRGARRRGRRPHRHERRRQDHADERDLRVREGHRARSSVFGDRIDRMASYRRARHGIGPRVPERAELRRPHRARDGHGRARGAPAIAAASRRCSRSRRRRWRSAASASRPTRSSATSGSAATPTTLLSRAVHRHAAHRRARRAARARRPADPARRADGRASRRRRPRRSARSSRRSSASSGRRS